MDTNAKIAKHYWNKLMGDSHELMPLDSSLFNDHLEAIGLNVVATAELPKETRYSMATPDSAWRTMVAVWEMAPKEDRIIQDVDRFATAVERIINEEGAYVEELDRRHGHRKAVQTLVKGGAITIGKHGVLTANTEAAMKTLEERWNLVMGGKGL